MGAGRAGRGRQAQDAPPTCGQLLQRYRMLAGLTQEELAERAGYSANYIGKLEQDQRDLPAAAADRLAAVLGLADQDRAALRAARERRQGGRELSARLLAGRDAEMTQIRQLLAGTGPPVLLLAGEPGIGKTRLLEEAAARGAGGGWGVARGGCLRRAQDAYAPLSGALDDALQRLPAGQRAEALRQAGRVDLLLPELALSGGPGPGEGEAPGGVQPEQQRRVLVSSAGRLLRSVASPAGTLLVLDDLHWAGPDAVDLLAALLAAAGPPLRVIGAYRDSETPARLDEFVADLARASLVRVLPLGPLTDADAGRLLLQLSPQEEQRPAVLPAIVRRAGGVPFFLVSYAEQVSGGGQGGALLAVPWTVAQVIGQRVAALPGPAKELLSVAAVAGRVVPHTLLAQVTGSDDEQVLEAVETALDARLLAEDGPDGYRFTHDLIRETVENGLSAARRRRLHRRIARALEHEPGASAESLAFHFSHSGEDGTAAGYLELAGDQAQQRVAYAAAAEFYAAAAARLEIAGRAGRGGTGHREAGSGLAPGRTLRCGDHRAGGRAGGVSGGRRRRERSPGDRPAGQHALPSRHQPRCPRRAGRGRPGLGTRRGLTRHVDLVGRAAAAAVRGGLVHQDGDPGPVAGSGRARGRQQPDAGHRYPGRGRRADPPGPTGGGRGPDGSGLADGADSRRRAGRPSRVPAQRSLPGHGFGGSLCRAERADAGRGRAGRRSARHRNEHRDACRRLATSAETGTAAATWSAGPSSASPPVPRPWPCAGSDCWPPP